MKLVHLANFNSTNVGNGALIHGLEKTMEEDFSISIDWDREPWDDYTFGLRDFDQDFVDKINQSDGLIVGGAVTFNGRDYNDRTGTRFELPFQYWNKIKKPVVFYGLSYRCWKGQEYHHLDKLKRTLEKILSYENMLLSVRNDGTREWLKEKTGIESDKIEVVPDSALYVMAEDGIEIPEIIDERKNIIISFNDEDREFRYRSKGESYKTVNQPREHVLGGLVETAEHLAEVIPANFILCPHYFDDYRMLSDFIASISPRIAHQMTVSTGLCRVKDTGRFYARYREADLAISMRVHSMSPCIGLGTPMVPYTTQDRMTSFLDKAGLSDIEVDAFSVDSSFSLLEKARYMLDNPSEIRIKFKKSYDSMREVTRKFHKRVKELLLS